MLSIEPERSILLSEDQLTSLMLSMWLLYELNGAKMHSQLTIAYRSKLNKTHKIRVTELNIGICYLKFCDLNLKVTNTSVHNDKNSKQYNNECTIFKIQLVNLNV